MITQELYTKILLLWRNSKLPIFFTKNIIPDKQYVDATMRKDKGEYPTIDICFRDPKKPQSYFGLECKKLLGIRKKNSFISNLSLDKNSIHPQYISRHMRESDNKEILLYHLFFDLLHKIIATMKTSA